MRLIQEKLISKIRSGVFTSEVEQPPPQPPHTRPFLGPAVASPSEVEQLQQYSRDQEQYYQQYITQLQTWFNLILFNLI